MKKITAIKKYITKDYLMKLFMIFIIIQPIIDIYILFKKSVVDFFGFSPATIIRIVCLGIIVLMAIFIIKFKKNHAWFLLYGLLVFIYTILHHINATHFTSLVPGNFNYSLVSELFYIIRMLMPLAAMFISYYITFDDNKINTMIKWLVILISGSIVVTNFLCISLGSYSKVTIKGNIFSWFIDNYKTYSYHDLASKGFFNDPNRIAALLVLLTPLLFYIFIKKPNNNNKILIILQLLAMFMLGTKVASYGFIVIVTMSIIIYWYFAYIKKEFKFGWTINNTLIAFLLMSLVLLPYSPVVNRGAIDNGRFKDYIGDKNEQQTKEKDKISQLEKSLVGVSQEEQNRILKQFLKQNYKNFSINPQFIVLSYSYQYDPIFWYDVMKQPLEYRTDFRKIETIMLTRVKEINNNSMDNWYGITFTRMQNIFDLERDFMSHYYTLGIIGLLLLLIPYPIIILICGIRMLAKYKYYFNFKNVMFILGLSITLFAAFYSGNVMDGLIVTIILGVILGQLIRNVFSK